MQRIAPLATLLGLLAAGAAPAAAQHEEDVLGRPVPLGQGRPALVLYANRATGRELQAHAFQLAWELREEKPVVVVQVDLRDVPGLFRGTARQRLRKNYGQALEAMRNLYRRHGEQPPADLEQSLYMVAHSDGAPHRAVGLEEGFERVVGQALSPTGRELVRGPIPQAAGTLERALSHDAAPQLSAHGAR